MFHPSDQARSERLTEEEFGFRWGAGRRPAGGARRGEKVVMACHGCEAMVELPLERDATVVCENCGAKTEIVGGWVAAGEIEAETWALMQGASEPSEDDLYTDGTQYDPDPGNVGC